MSAPRLHPHSTRHLAWLLWVLLLLPAAQVATVWHGVSHAAQAVQQSAPTPVDPLSQAGHCDLCLVAATIHGGALPSAPILLSRPPARHEAPLTAFVASWEGSPPHPYRSRAPPASSL